MRCWAFPSTDLICKIPASRLTWRHKSTLATVGPTPLQILGHMVRFWVQVFSAGDLPITSGGPTCSAVQKAAGGMPCTTDPDSNLCPCNYWCDDKPYILSTIFLCWTIWVIWTVQKKPVGPVHLCQRQDIVRGPTRPCPRRQMIFVVLRLAEDVGTPFSVTISAMVLRQDAQILRGSVRKWNAIRLQPASATSTNYLMITSMVNVTVYYYYLLFSTCS